MTNASSFRASRAIGAMFFSVFGGAWLALWSVRAFGVRIVILALIAASALALFGFAWSTFQQNKSAWAGASDTPAKQRASKVFNIVNAGQWILILVIGNVLVNAGHPEWVIAAVVFIVGLHFLPLAHVFDYAPHYVTGSALMLWAIGYPSATAAGPANPVGCLGAGLILWAGALYGLFARARE